MLMDVQLPMNAAEINAIPHWKNARLFQDYEEKNRQKNRQTPVPGVLGQSPPV